MKQTTLPRIWLICLSCIAASTQVLADAPLKDKTLVVWVSPANLTQSGGSALTVNDTTIDRFDGIVLAEIEPQVWMPGSNGYSRTNKAQADWPKETAGPDQFVQMAIVYRGQQITVYRDGEVYAGTTRRANLILTARVRPSCSARDISRQM